MPPVGFKHTISAGERPQAIALDRAAVLVVNVPFIASANASGKIFHSAKYSYLPNYAGDAGRSVGSVGYCWPILTETGICQPVLLKRSDLKLDQNLFNC
jgi:hypothetical protein